MIKNIKILDTTLRDGEQAPGFSMNNSEKLKMALQLEKLNVDIIEAGFPYASEGEFKAVSKISDTINNTTVAALCRAREADIDSALASLKSAKSPMINIFAPVSDLHLEHVVKKTRAEILEISVRSIEHAKKHCDNVEFTPVDCSRADRKFVVEFMTEMITAGANYISVTDTVGYSTPDEYGDLISHIKKNVPNISSITLSAHCHNDLGLAAANSLAAIQNGADMIEGTINGIGERAGNTSLEEVIMAIKIRGEHFNAETNINHKEIYTTSKLLSEITGHKVQKNKAVVGDNAFAHDAGVHLDGFKKNPLTYEILTPELINAPRPKLELSKYSGRKALNERFLILGHDLNEIKLGQAYKLFIKLTETKKVIEDNDLNKIIDDL